ncbi:MAG: hypothetical protein HN341_00270 [Verrucomicrobia bacterium]|jgi:hypothetical protein|nr:hypothetical protein [Verrucomicrobiota bacterium]
MSLAYTRRTALQGLLVYATGDTIATLILGQFMWSRLLGMMVVGSTLYAWEVPTVFRWIDRRTAALPLGVGRSAYRTLLAVLYFNPLWIARHLLIIAIVCGNWDALQFGLLRTASLSWLVNIPISIVGNAVIQVWLPLRWRFFGSAIFSGLMAIYYALTGVWFDAG